MTAVDVDALAKLREALAAHRLTTPRQCLCGERQDGEWSDLWHAEHLLPVVDRIANQRAAAELRAIGRAGLAASPGAHPVTVPVGYLFQRADALDPS